MYFGRGFTDYDLKKAVVRASGGRLNGFYTSYRDMPLWAVIEAIEIVSDVATEDGA